VSQRLTARLAAEPQEVSVNSLTPSCVITVCKDAKTIWKLRVRRVSDSRIFGSATIGALAAKGFVGRR